MSFSEREVGRALKVELESHEYLFEDRVNNVANYTRFKVYLNKHVPTNSQKFKKFWISKKLDERNIPPPQPEIDMILVDKWEKWRAIELKAIRKIDTRMFPSYYFGMGQTLAYLSFGFDEVAIWQCFDGVELKDEEIYRYDDALNRIRNPLREIVGKTCFKITFQGEKPRIECEVFKPANSVRTWNVGIGVNTVAKKNLIRSVSYNPFLQNQEVKAIREFLEGQRRDVWDKPK